MMRKAARMFLAASVLSCWMATPAVARQDAPRQDKQEDVVSVSTNLVELRAVVTDARGQLVGDLSKDDFEVLENDRPRQVGFFSVERVRGARGGDGSKSASDTGRATGRPSTRASGSRSRRSS